jgi:transcription antitermination factor NusG
MLAKTMESDFRPAHWFIVVSEPRAEFKAMQWIIGRGIHAYVPVVRAIQRRARGKTASILEPMFRNYLFVGDPENGKRDLIPHLPCVMKVLESNGRWATLSDRAVQLIFQQEMTERFAMPPEPKKAKQFKPKEALKIIDGQFAGFNCRFDRLATKNRIEVLHWLLGREVRTTLHADQVAAA